MMIVHAACRAHETICTREICGGIIWVKMSSPFPQMTRVVQILEKEIFRAVGVLYWFRGFVLLLRGFCGFMGLVRGFLHFFHWHAPMFREGLVLEILLEETNPDNLSFNE